MDDNKELEPSWDEMVGLSLREIVEAMNRTRAGDCPMCGHDTYEVLQHPDDPERPGLFKVPVEGQGSRYLPCYALSCKGCGNTQFLQAMGLWKLHKRGPRAKEGEQA